jgi:hypothetical protein
MIWFGFSLIAVAGALVLAAVMLGARSGRP